MSKKAVVEVQDVKLPVISLALEKIKVDETKNLRRFNPDAKSVEELANDIQANGMINPVLVRRYIPVEGEVTDAEYELVAGYQRMKALAHLNTTGYKVETVSASVKDIPVEDSRRSKILNLKENLRRSEISYIDSAFAIKELLESGMTAIEVAKEFNKSGAWVSYVVKMSTLRPEIQKKIHSGEINFRLAKTLPDMTEAEQDAAIAELKAGASGSDLAKRAKAKKPRKNKRGRKSKEDAAENRNLSSKQAVLLIEERVVELEQTEGRKTKADENVVNVYKSVVKFLTGGIGVKALHNQLMKVL